VLQEIAINKVSDEETIHCAASDLVTLTFLHRQLSVWIGSVVKTIF